jgi:hypothetical protein
VSAIPRYQSFDRLPCANRETNWWHVAQTPLDLAERRTPRSCNRDLWPSAIGLAGFAGEGRRSGVVARWLADRLVCGAPALVLKPAPLGAGALDQDVEIDAVQALVIGVYVL